MPESVAITSRGNLELDGMGWFYIPSDNLT
jgi:hypothetical protein